MALNISKNQASLVAAWQEVLSQKSLTNWAVFGYEGQTNILQVVATGDGPLEEMSESLSAGKCQYAFCRVKDPKTTLNKNVFIIWQGDGAPDTRKGACANHVRPISDLFKGAHVTITARTEEEVESQAILEKVSKASSSKFDFDASQRSVSPPPARVGSVYQKTDPSLIIKERNQYLQVQQKEDGNARQEAENSRRKSQQSELQEINRQRQASDGENSEKQMTYQSAKSTNNSAQVALESKTYGDMERRKWEETSPKLAPVTQKPDSVPAKPPPKPPHQPQPLRQNIVSTTKPTNLMPKLILAPKKVADPSAQAREEEEKRRFEEAQQDTQNDDKERRLKAESMRQERLKEAQSLISGRRQSHDPTESTSPPTAHAAGDDVATRAYREEERRKFEASQKEQEKDEKDRRNRSETFRQERLRELAVLTQPKEAEKDMFSSIGQTVKDKRIAGKKGQDPEVSARREEEKRRWEEAQRESQAEEMERRNKADQLRKERADEAAALISHRSGEAKSVFEQTSSKQEGTSPSGESRSLSGSAQKIAKSLFEHSPAASHQRQHPPSKVPLTPQTSKSSVQSEVPDPVEEQTRIHPSQRALPLVSHEDNGHQDSNGGERVRRDSGDQNGRSHQEPFFQEAATHVQRSTEDFASKSVAEPVVPVPAVNAWKQGLPVRPPSDDEDDAAWEDSTVKSPTLSSHSSGHSVGLTARALFDYQAADETEISFDPGDLITQIDKVDSGWYQGMAPSGNYGLFPANYVEMVE